jgi:hypothetical protein
MSHAARVVMNDNGYAGVSGKAETGVFVNVGKRKYYIGYEEWNNLELFKSFNVGYMDCYRPFVREGITDLYLYRVEQTQPIKTYRTVGILEGVTQIQNHEIPALRDLIMQNIGLIQASFNQIGDPGPINGPNHPYNQSLQSNHIVANPGKSFVLNIRYKSMRLFEGETANLTDLTGSIINEKWKYIRHRYDMIEEWRKHWKQ